MIVSIGRMVLVRWVGGEPRVGELRLLIGRLADNLLAQIGQLHIVGDAIGHIEAAVLATR